MVMAPLSERPALLLIALALVCWVALLALLIVGGLDTVAPLDPQRFLFYGLALAAPLLTLVPLERATGLLGLTIEGSVGLVILIVMLAIVPAPRAGLLALSELPIYGLMLLALFLSVSALARPLIYQANLRFWPVRALPTNSRRVRRQSYEVGLLPVAMAVLAALRVFTWISLLLVLVILLLTELLISIWAPADV